eukprot:CAMPEP_0117500074 /NCGR_PEP_ID=MMETSP0784-20121206/22585_1 /TAXON_ID=39447 /ORGANISM="" /LENGTH=342 /DNA_ID=CAMNT_0005295265 /DNA_START=92 /DNA_END=1119 /DNA_ORIENTATION=+
MGNCASTPCDTTPTDELQEFDGGVDVLADARASTKADIDDGYTNDSQLITQEYEKDTQGENRYIEAHASSFRTYFDKEFDELDKTIAVDKDLQEERPTYTFSTAAKYEGQWKGRHRYGFGVQKWVDGASYQGQWRGDQAYGHGRFVNSKGETTYVGQWKHNMAQGMGIAYQTDSTYSGEWKDDLQSGYGVETWKSDGARFEGEFKDGTKHGFGTYFWPGGAIQVGVWKNGEMNGGGDYKAKDGTQVQGMWADNHKNGTAKYSWANGEKYEGQYVAGQREGFGIYHFSDGKAAEMLLEGGAAGQVGRKVDMEVGRKVDAQFPMRRANGRNICCRVRWKACLLR